MEVRNLKEHTGWYASYMDDDKQAKALIICQQKKIEKLEKLLKKIKGEIELSKKPKEYQSVSELLNQNTDVEHIEGYFKWIG